MATAEAATTTAPTAVTVRAVPAATSSDAPFSLGVVNGVSGGSVGFYNADGGRMLVSAGKTVNGVNSSWTMVMPRKLAAGTYPIAADGSGPITAYLPSIGCEQGVGSLVVHDAAWTSTGAPTRLSLTVKVPCKATADGTSVAEVRLGEPAGTQLVGILEPAATSAPWPSTTVGTAKDTVVSFKAAGSTSVKAGPASIAWQSNTTYPAFSVLADGCNGKTLSAGQTCGVTVRFLPKVTGDPYQAVVRLGDGNSAGPSGGRILGTATALADQPIGVEVSAQDHAAVVSWGAANTSTTNHVYDHYDVVGLDANGNETGVVGTAPGGTTDEGAPTSTHRLYVDGLQDRTSYSFAVRPFMPDGSPGPLSAPVTAITAGRVLLYGDNYNGTGRDGLNAMSLDPRGVPSTRHHWLRDTDHIALSPDESLIAASDRHWTGQAYACTLYLLERRTLAALVTVPRDSGNGCDTFPTFTSATTVAFSRTDDLTANGATPRLVSLDTTTGTVTDVPGGAGLTQPAAAPDGSLVAVDPVAHELVRVSAGVAEPIPGTADGSQPAVAADGRIAFVHAAADTASTVAVVPAAGGQLSTLSDAMSSASAPSWTRDGAHVYWAQDYDVWRWSATAGATRVTSTPSVDEAAPVVIEVPDTTAPVVVVPVLPAYTRTPSQSATATATDPGPGSSGVSVLDAESAPTAAGPWAAPNGWTGVAAGPFVLPVANGQTSCIRVRAHDNAGNTSNWSTPTCTRGDTTAPALKTLSTPGLYSSTGRLTVTQAFSDGGSGVAKVSYRYRRAPASSTAFTGYTAGAQTASSFTLAMAAGNEYCVSFNAVDKVGNTSPWSPERCSIAALEDRSLAASAASTRLTSSAYHAANATQLRAIGAQLTLATASGRQVGVLVRTCSTCGYLDVYIGSSRLGRINTASSTTRNQNLIWLPRQSVTRTGKLVLRQVTSRSVIVDAVVVQHG